MLERRRDRATAAFLVLDYRGRRRRGGGALRIPLGRQASDQARAHYDFMSI